MQCQCAVCSVHDFIRSAYTTQKVEKYLCLQIIGISPPHASQIFLRVSDSQYQANRFCFIFFSLHKTFCAFLFPLKSQNKMSFLDFFCPVFLYNLVSRVRVVPEVLSSILDLQLHDFIEVSTCFMRGGALIIQVISLPFLCLFLQLFFCRSSSTCSQERSPCCILASPTSPGSVESSSGKSMTGLPSFIPLHSRNLLKKEKKKKLSP